MVPMARLPSAHLRQLTAVDGRDHVALVAETADGRSVGIARFVRDPADRRAAEAAVTVVDAWHGRGVGSRLASALVAQAQQRGIRRFDLFVRSDNQPALRL